MPARLLPLLLVLVALVPSVARVAIVHRCAGAVTALEDCCCDHGQARWKGEQQDRCCEIVSQGTADGGFAPDTPVLPPAGFTLVVPVWPEATFDSVDREPPPAWAEPRGPPRTPRFLRLRSIRC